MASGGVAVAALGMVGYTQVDAHTSVLYLSGALLVIGTGIGATITPSMAAAFQMLSPAETPRGISALNTIQRIAGATGTAAFAIILQHSLSTRLPGRPAAAIAALSRPGPAHTAATLAGASASRGRRRSPRPASPRTAGV